MKFAGTTAILLGVICASAHADLVVGSAPTSESSGSWRSLTWVIDSTASRGQAESGFDLIAARLRSGGPFAESAMSPVGGFSAGWTSSRSSDNVAYVTGRTKWLTTFQLSYDAPIHEPLTVDLAVFRRDVLLASFRNDWDGTTWSSQMFFGPDWDQEAWTPLRSTIAHAPTPGALFLGLIGLGLVGWLKRRLA